MPSINKQLGKLAKALKIVAADGSAFSLRLFHSRAALAAENVFLRGQLALFQEHEQKAQRTTAADRFTLSTSARFFDWREALMIIKPATLIGWHVRNAFRRFWRWPESRPVGRPPLSGSLREVIRQMAAENPNWGEKQIADELLLKLGLRVSPRTVAKYVKRQPRATRIKDQRWSTFMPEPRASDRSLRFLCVSYREFASPLCFRGDGNRIAASPSTLMSPIIPRQSGPSSCARPCPVVTRMASWFMIGTAAFPAELDKQVEAFGVKVIRTPVRTPTANLPIANA